MTDEPPEGLVDVELLRLPVLDWEPVLGPYLDDYIPRMCKSAHTSRKEILRSLNAPDHEYRFQRESEGEEWKHPHENYRMVSHEFGDWIIFTIWHKGEYTYHATVQVLNGMAMEEAAWTIYLRWLDTRPKGYDHFGGSFGTGKSKSKWRR